MGINIEILIPKCTKSCPRRVKIVKATENKSIIFLVGYFKNLS